MKIKLLLLSLVFSNFNLFAQQIVDTKVKQNLKKTSATFEENKGQMKDQNWLPRPDVLYYGSQEGMNKSKGAWIPPYPCNPTPPARSEAGRRRSIAATARLAGRPS